MEGTASKKETVKGRPEGPEKSKEEILAERKAKKAEKAAKKTGGNATVVPKQTSEKPAKKSETGGGKSTVPQQPSGDTGNANPSPVTNAPALANVPKPEEATKSKAQLKAEGRQKQEAQRAAKAAALEKPAATKPQPTKRVPDQIQADRPSVQNRMSKRLQSQQVPLLPPSQKKVQLFSHLQQQERRPELLTKNLLVNKETIHPAVIELGLKYARGIVVGSNARAVALLLAFKRIISDYTTPEHKELSRDLEASLKPAINFLKQCRPISVSMGNAIRHLKRQITTTPSEYSDTEAKKYLHECIDNYIRENVELAGKAICDEASKKIASGDVILTYGYSSLLFNILHKAYVEDGKKFRVVVLDGNPRFEGLQLLRKLTAAKIPAVYMLISGASYIMPQVTKVFLGAHALLANGNVTSRVGSSQVALVARAYNVPVLVCCETHKFCERVQTDSFVFNELGDPDDLIAKSVSKPSPSIKQRSVANWRDMDKLSLLNLTYDVTPGELVTAVITELAVLPCTSVPVVLRVKQAETAL